MNVTVVLTFPDGNTVAQEHTIAKDTIQDQAALVSSIRRQHPNAQNVKVLTYL